MPTLDAIQQAIAFIEDHLCEEVGVGDIADAVGYSLYHFSRTFNAAVHHTPYDYLMRRRLSESARDLLATDRLIIDIAYDYAFANPETYTRAFKRMFRILPSTARSDGRLPYRTAMPRLTPAHLAHHAGLHPPRPQLLALPRLSLTGFTTLLSGDDASTGDGVLPLWQLLQRELAWGENTSSAEKEGDIAVAEAPATVSETRAWSMIRYMDGQEGGQRLYAATVQGANPPPLVPTLVVPPGRYIRCDLDGASPDTLALTRDYIAYTWLPRAEYGTLAPFDLLAYPSLPMASGEVPTALYMALG